MGVGLRVWSIDSDDDSDSDTALVGFVACGLAGACTGFGVTS